MFCSFGILLPNKLQESVNTRNTISIEEKQEINYNRRYNKFARIKAEVSVWVSDLANYGRIVNKTDFHWKHIVDNVVPASLNVGNKNVLSG